MKAWFPRCLPFAALCMVVMIAGCPRDENGKYEANTPYAAPADDLLRAIGSRAGESVEQTHAAQQPPEANLATTNVSCAPPVEPQRRQAALAALEKLSATIEHDSHGQVQGIALQCLALADGDLVHLAAFPEMEALDINGGEVTDEGLTHLAGLRRLKRLYLQNLPITNAGLERLKMLTGLVVLSLQNTNITGDGLDALKEMKDLEVLNLAHCRLSDESLARLTGLSKLNTLCLEGTKVSGAALKHVGALPNLRVLNLDHCRIIDRDLLRLEDLGELRMLYLHGNKVTAERIKKFQKRMSGLAVYYD